MASPLKHDDTLTAIAAEIARLRVALIDAERHAGELVDGEEATLQAVHRADATRMLLEAAKDRYIAESERLRSEQCPVHGKAIIVVCPTCVEAASKINPAFREQTARALASVRAEARVA